MARVLMLEEIPKTYAKAAVWIEMNETGHVPTVALYKHEHYPWMVFISSTAPDAVYYHKQEYRRKWRAWSRRPDPEECEREKWEVENNDV